MFKIGDFSKLSQVSVKALRYYDHLGLLRPSVVDRWTGYRYYSAEQLPRLNRILVLKDLGFSLDQIGQVLDEDLPAEQIRGMLRLKRAELQEQVAAEMSRLARVEARLRQIEKEDTMPDYEVVLKKVDPVRVAGVEEVIPTRNDVGPTFDRLFDEVEDYIEQQGGQPAGPGIALWHDTEYRERDMRVAAAWPVANGLSGDDFRIKVHELPAETMASTVHTGSFDGFMGAYSALMEWIDANGYRISGPNREVYVQYERGGDPSKYVTEIQVPVEEK